MERINMPLLLSDSSSGRKGEDQISNGKLSEEFMRRVSA